MVERTARYCLLTAFWIPLAVCTYLALTPSPPEPVFRVSDIVLHGMAFTYLTFALGLAYAGLSRWVLVLVMTGYGLLIEVAQSFEPARSAELKDLAVDLVGIVLALALLPVLAEPCRRLLRGILGLLLQPGR